MELADRPPHAKTCLNLDARAYEFMAERFPEIADRLRAEILTKPRVHLAPPGTLPVSEGKAKRVIDNRSL